MISKLIIGPLLACLVIEPARVIAQALGLNRLRAQYPEMFDSAVAAENVRLALADAGASMSVPVLTPDLKGR